MAEISSLLTLLGQLALLAYEYDPATGLLLLLGSHENFYRELKRP